MNNSKFVKVDSMKIEENKEIIISKRGDFYFIAQRLTFNNPSGTAVVYLKNAIKLTEEQMQAFKNIIGKI